MSDIKTTEERQAELGSCLIDLSKKIINEGEEQEYIRRLQDIYTVDFRHSYSKFYSWVEDIAREGDFTSLLDNINRIKVATEKSEKDKDFSLKIFKLADHLNLEIARYDKNSKTDAERDNLKKSVYNVKNEINNTKNETENIIETVRKEVKNIKLDIIAIIGVFSGIAFAFSGCMQSFAEAFRSIKETPSSKLTFFVLLIGLVLFDIIYSMFYIIGKLLDRTTKISLGRFLLFNIAVMIVDAAILNYSELKIFIFEIIALVHK